MTGPGEKTGTVFTGTSHGVCALIGAGVLALPQAVASMGWVAGMLCLLAFYVIQMGASYMLASLYEVDGKKRGRYQDVVAAFLGPRGKLAVTICQGANIVAFTIAYTITAAVSMQEMAEHLCGGRSGCLTDTWQLALIFGGIQLFFSQLPNLEGAWWMSVLGAAMSLLYAGIALGLCIAHAGNGHGTLGGIETSTVDKIFSIANSLGAMAFAFSFSVILLEIQDTLREPPKAVKSMRRVIDYSLGISMAFYVAISVSGYLAFGNSVPGDVLTAFSNPSWLITLANGAVVVHMVSAFQVYAQPLFVLIEWEIWVKLLKHRSPRRPHSVTSATAPRIHSALTAAKAAGSARQESAASMAGTAAHHGENGSAPADFHLQMSPFDNHKCAAPLPDAAAMKVMEEEESWEVDLEQPPALSPNLSVRRSSMLDLHFHASPAPLWLRLTWRSAYVAAVTMVAVVMPFFSTFVGLVGGLMFWPLSIAFPVACWLVVRKPTGWRRGGVLAVAGVMLLVALAAVVGSVRQIITSWSDFSIF